MSRPITTNNYTTSLRMAPLAQLRQYDSCNQLLARVANAALAAGYAVVRALANAVQSTVVEIADKQEQEPIVTTREPIVTTRAFLQADSLSKPLAREILQPKPHQILPNENFLEQDRYTSSIEETRFVEWSMSPETCPAEHYSALIKPG